MDLFLLKPNLPVSENNPTSKHKETSAYYDLHIIQEGAILSYQMKKCCKKYKKGKRCKKCPNQ